MKVTPLRKSSPKLLRCLSLGGLATAALLLLGTATPVRAAFPIIDDFNAGNDDYWTQYSLPNDPANNYYGAATFTFPTNPAGPANFAYRIQVPILTNDPDSLAFPRGGSFREDSYVSPDNAGGRFLVGIDLVAWNNNWDNSFFGLGWWSYVDPNTSTNFRSYVAGWGPGEKTMGIAVVDSTKIDVGGYGIAGSTATDSTVLNPTHHYREVASSHDGVTFMVQLFDLVQPTNVWQSAIATDYTFFDLGEKGGYSGVLLVNTDLPSTNQTQGADVTFDNYYADVPADGAMPAVVTDLSPQPGGKTSDYYPVVQVGIFNRDTSIDTTYAPLLYMDGVLIPTSNTNLTNDLTFVYKPGNANSTIAADPVVQFPGATITYTHRSLLQPSSLHTNKVVWRDSNNVLYSNIWSWTYNAPVKFANTGFLTVPGFASRTVVSYKPTDPTYANIAQGAAVPLNLPNNIATARAVLNYQYPVNLAATNIVQTVNWGIFGNEFAGVTNFPGLCDPTAWPNSFVVEVMAYLQLPAGTNTFWLAHDDAVGVYSGTNASDTSVTIFESNGATSETFKWFVPEAGLYPIHIIFEEGGGAGYLGLASANGTGGQGAYVGAPGGIPAFYPIPSSVPPIYTPTVPAWTSWSLMSSSVVRSNSNYSTTVATSLTSSASTPVANATPITVAGASCDGNSSSNALNLVVTGWNWGISGTNTISFAAPTTAKYYRLIGPGTTQILNCQKVGANMSLTYRWQQP